MLNSTRRDSKQATAKPSIAKQCADFMWSTDHASQGMGMSIEYIDSGIAHIAMDVTKAMLNGHRICHGGFIFTLADSAFAFACNSYNDATVAQGGSIDFLRPAQLGDRLTAKAVEMSRGKRTGIYDVSVFDQNEKLIALFRGKSFASNRPLVEDLVNNSGQ